MEVEDRLLHYRNVAGFGSAAAVTHTGPGFHVAISLVRATRAAHSPGGQAAPIGPLSPRKKKAFGSFWGETQRMPDCLAVERVMGEPCSDELLDTFRQAVADQLDS